MFATAEELKYEGPSDDELRSYRMLFLRGKIAALDEIAERHWDLLSPPLPINASLHLEVNSFERMHLVAALDKAEGNKTKAAKILGMTMRVYQYRCGQLGIDMGGRVDVRKYRAARNKLVPKEHPLNTAS
jgi:DNA-binding NtrC family response regulator